MPKDGTNQKRQPATFAHYRSTMRELTAQITSVFAPPVVFPVGWPAILAALGISDAMFDRDVVTAIRVHRLDKLIALREPGQADRVEAVHRIHEVSKSPGVTRSAYDGAMRALDVELSSHDELGRLQRLRDSIRMANPRLFAEASP